ncbi:MAG: GNAT family N-acetyltransferase [Bacteroidales bacterium]
MISIRKAVDKDVSLIVAFQEAMALETENLRLDNNLVSKGVKEVFRNTARGCYYIAEYNGEVVASLLITYEWSDWRNADVWWFQSVYVIPSFRRKGIFRLMYDYIRQESVKANAAGLRLYVESNNTVARKTYEAMGMSCEHYTTYEWLR